MLELYITANPENKCLDIKKNRFGNRSEIHFKFGLGVYAVNLLADDLGPILREMIAKFNPRWIQAGDYGFIINFDALREEIGSSPELDRWTGSTGFTPMNIKMSVSSVINIPEVSLNEYLIEFSFPPPFEDEENKLWIPPLIDKSLRLFKKDHPQMHYTAFIMMQFGKGKAYSSIVAAIKKAFEDFGVIALRADDKTYHPDLYYNILTYIHGCGIGVAIFDRIESDEYNPNVSLELGYMLALDRPLCILKDQSLPKLPSDIVGRLYVPFDTHNPKLTISRAVTKWLEERGYRK
jgi:hypothetical protein